MSLFIQKYVFTLFGVFVFALLPTERGWAQDEFMPYSPNLYGQLGLNTVPSARMDQPGTIRLGGSRHDPYTHGFIGFQLAKPLSVTFRQTSQTSGVFDSPDRLYPGMDLKLRLLMESQYVPELSIGVQSAFGHKRMSGEYIAASKRYKNLDFTAGLGWGRYGSAGHFSNPLKTLHNHFGQKRSLDGENPVHVNDLFTGETVGLFAGLEYFTPIEGLSFKADWGADRFNIEKSEGENSPAPWGVSLNYKPQNWADLSLGMLGGDTLMARINLQNNLKSWAGRTHGKEQKKPFPQNRSTTVFPQAIKRQAEQGQLHLQDIRTGPYLTYAHLKMDGVRTLPLQIGRAGYFMTKDSPAHTEVFALSTENKGLYGPTLHFMRRDLENALAQKQGSAEEIWHNVQIDETAPNKISKTNAHRQKTAFRFILDTAIGLSEEDNGILYRSAVVGEAIEDVTNPLTGATFMGTQARVNVLDNLHKLQDYRNPSPLPVRSNEHEFAAQRFALDRAYTSFHQNLSDNWYSSITAGYLEEMYAGAGSEILYRPFGRTYAVGAELWQVFKRDPNSTLNLKLNGDHLLTGHVNAWYEFPDTDLTASIKAGRYLGEDWGVTGALEKHLDNGVKVQGYITTTNAADIDIFGSTSNIQAGMTLSMPISNIPFIGKGSEARTHIKPFGRDTGQYLDKPQGLYNLTQPLSYRAITRQWNEILD